MSVSVSWNVAFIHAIFRFALGCAPRCSFATPAMISSMARGVWGKTKVLSTVAMTF